MARGTVKYFNDHKGYGFITEEGQNKEVYVHFSAIEGSGFRTLHEGEEVEFETKANASGQVATHVQKI